MQKLILVSFMFILSLLNVTNAQQNQQQIPIYKPQFIVSDIYVAISILETVDIKGNEVEPFLEVKQTLNGYLESAKQKNMKVSDKVTADMPANVAQNTVNFLSRATLKGNMADAYKRFIDAIIASAKPQQ